jgi:phage-related protein (TIGR01555 family)
MKILDNVKSLIGIAKQIKDVGSMRTFIGGLADRQNNRDVITNSAYTKEFRLPIEQLENAYMTSWVAKRIIELPTELALANGFSLKLKNKNDEKKFWDKWEELRLEHLICDAQKMADLYGSSTILLKNKLQSPEQPYTNFKNLEFKHIEHPFYTPLPSSDEIYSTDRINFHLLGVIADLSNVAVFSGVKVVKRLSPEYKYFGMSVLQNIWKAMISDDLITTAVSNLIYRSSTPLYKINGLNNLIDMQKQSLVLSKIQTMEDSRGIFGAIAIDSEDDFSMVGQSINALADLDRRSAERVCGATGYPATLILGKSPDGQNSTGKHDEKLMLMSLKRQQNKMIEPSRKMAYALMDNLGIDRTDCEFKFNNPQFEDKEQTAKTDSTELDNALKMSQLLNNPKIINRYLKDCDLLTEDEFNELDKLSEDFDEADRFENETEQIQADTDTEIY